jgi:Uma2 family endonuclease
MSIAYSNPQAPHVKRWTKEEYNDFVDRGAFHGKRLYLFRGELIEMASMKQTHALSIVKGTKILFSLFDAKLFDVRIQMPFDVPGESLPEPDLLVCTAEAGRRFPHPSKAELIIEVAEWSLDHDRDKALEYAAAGVQDYWILDLTARCIEVYRGPLADRSTPLGFRYPPPTIVAEGESISPLAAPRAQILVKDLIA